MADKKVKPAEVKIDTTNPFNKGVSYDMFLENVKGNITVDSMLKKHNLSDDDIAWIKDELDKHEQNKNEK